MRIKSLSIYLVSLPLKRAIRHATKTRSTSENVIVRTVLTDGTVGFGEGVPRDYVTGESTEAAFAELCDLDLHAIQNELSSFAEVVAFCETLPVAGAAARCALELSVLDAFGRHFGASLSDVTPLVAPDLCKHRREVRYSGIITSQTGTKLFASLLIQRLFGLRQIKVKVGIAGQDDTRRLRLVRRVFPEPFGVRVDVNGAWLPETLSQRFEELGEFNLEWIEQPFAKNAGAGVQGICGSSRVAIMLDESICSIADAKLALAQRVCHGINIRLSKCGGLIPSLKLADFARRQGLDTQLGCQVGESAILSAAGRHFACSVDGLSAVEGSYDRFLLRDNLSDQDVSFGFGGVAAALDGPGLGLKVSQVSLSRLATRTLEMS